LTLSLEIYILPSPSFELSSLRGFCIYNWLFSKSVKDAKIETLKNFIEQEELLKLTIGTKDQL
jgi:hypothetical protein